MNHFRHCPKHRKPLPCAHCVLAAKPAQTAVAVEQPEIPPAANPVIVSVTVEEIPVTPQQSVAQAQETVRILLEAVAPIEGTHRSRNRKVKKVMQDIFAGKPAEIIPEPIPEPVLPELSPKTVTPVPYDPNVYRTEISKALASARRNLRGPEGRKDFEDLEQIVAIEIWKATKHYGSKMNEKLAYRIAKNQADKFLKAKADEPPMLSFDKPAENDEGKKLGTSEAEQILFGRKVAGRTSVGIMVEGIRPGTWDPFSLDKLPETANWLQALHERGGIEQLKQLVKKWHGTKRTVAEAILKHPDLTIREIPGVPKSTAARVRKVVLAEFESFLRNSHVVEAKVDTNNNGTN